MEELSRADTLDEATAAVDKKREAADPTLPWELITAERTPVIAPPLRHPCAHGRSIVVAGGQAGSRRGGIAMKTYCSEGASTPASGVFQAGLRTDEAQASETGALPHGSSRECCSMESN